MLGVVLTEAVLNTDYRRIFAMVCENCTKFDWIPEDSRIRKALCSQGQYDRLPELIGGSCEAFYHFALGGAEASGERSISAWQENISGTLNALHAAKQLGYRTFVGAGPQAGYDKRGWTGLTLTPRLPHFSAYGVVKYVAGPIGKAGGG